jgi:DNA-directed RNA polymerase alpha subunit
MFDLHYKYRVVRGDQVEYGQNLAYCRLIGGEWFLSSDGPPVEVVRQQGVVCRWRLSVGLDGNVKLTEVATVGNIDADKARRLAALIDREEQRRVAKLNAKQRAEAEERKRRSAMFGKGVKRAVLCLSVHPPKRFESVADAAEWAGVKHPSMIRALKRPPPGRRRRTCCGQWFVYEDEYRKAG